MALSPFSLCSTITTVHFQNFLKLTLCPCQMLIPHSSSFTFEYEPLAYISWSDKPEREEQDNGLAEA